MKVTRVQKRSRVKLFVNGLLLSRCIILIITGNIHHEYLIIDFGYVLQMESIKLIFLFSSGVCSILTDSDVNSSSNQNWSNSLKL